MLKNKKSNMWSTTLMPVIAIFIIGLGVFIGYSLFLEFYTNYQASGLLTDLTTSQFEKFGGGILMFDNIAVVILIVMIIASIWILSKEDHNAVEFVAAWIMLAFIGFIGYVFSYAFGQFLNESTIYAISLSFPKISVLATNGHWIALGSFLLSQVFLYAKQKGGQPVEPLQ